MLARLKAMEPVFPNTTLRIVCMLTGFFVVIAFATLAQPQPIFILLSSIAIVVPLSDLSRSYSLTLAALLRLSGIIFALAVIILSFYSLFS